MKANLTSEDIDIIKKARARNLGNYIMMIFASLFFFFITFFGSKHPESWDSGPPPLWLLYVFYISSILLMLGAIKYILSYQLDIIRGYKLVMITNCRKYTESGDGGDSYYIIIDDYGKVDLFGYNEDWHLKSFSDQKKRYEIHLAPLSKVLLHVRYIHVIVDENSSNS